MADHLNEDETLELGNYIVIAHEGDVILEDKEGRHNELCRIKGVDFYEDLPRVKEEFERYSFSLNDYIKFIRWYFQIISDPDSEEMEALDRLEIIRFIKELEEMSE